MTTRVGWSVGFATMALLLMGLHAQQLLSSPSQLRRVQEPQLVIDLQSKSGELGGLLAAANGAVVVDFKNDPTTQAQMKALMTKKQEALEENKTSQKKKYSVAVVGGNALQVQANQSPTKDVLSEPIGLNNKNVALSNTQVSVTNSQLNKHQNDMINIIGSQVLVGEVEPSSGKKK